MPLNSQEPYYAADTTGIFTTPSTNGLEIWRIDSDGIISSWAVLPNFTINNQYPTSWNIARSDSIKFSPNHKLLAIVATSTNRTSLFVYRFDDDSVKEVQLSQIDPSVLPTWSLDSKKIALMTGRSDKLNYAYDLTTSHLSQIFSGVPIHFAWMPNSNDIAFIGDAACVTDCMTYSDLYLYHLTTSTTQVITSPSFETLAESMDKFLGISRFIWSPIHDRFYFEVYELSDVSSIAQLYSVGSNGDIDLEVDLAALYPSVTPTEPRALFLNTFDDDVYVVTYTKVPASGVRSQWSIIRGSEGTYSVIYQQGFGSDVRTIDSVAVSPNGKYIAINGADAARTSIGHIIVYDVSINETTLDAETSSLTCNLEWLSNTQLAFVESPSACQETHSPTQCDAFYIYDTSNDAIESAPELPTGDAYLVSPQVPPGLQPPVASASANQVITDLNGDGTETVTVAGSGSRDNDGMITSYVWTEVVNGNVVQHATVASPQILLSNGLHTIMLTVTDNDGATDTDEVEIIVNALSAFIAEVEALPPDAMIPACKADVLVVARAMTAASR